MNNIQKQLEAYQTRKEESPYDVCKDIAYMVEGKSDKKSIIKFLALTRGWSMHDLVMMREDLPKKHPSYFLNKYNVLTTPKKVQDNDKGTTL